MKRRHRQKDLARLCNLDLTTTRIAAKMILWYRRTHPGEYPDYMGPTVALDLLEKQVAGVARLARNRLLTEKLPEATQDGKDAQREFMDELHNAYGCYYFYWDQPCPWHKPMLAADRFVTNKPPIPEGMPVVSILQMSKLFSDPRQFDVEHGELGCEAFYPYPQICPYHPTKLRAKRKRLMLR